MHQFLKKLGIDSCYLIILFNSVFFPHECQVGALPAIVVERSSVMTAQQSITPKISSIALCLYLFI